MSVKETVRNLTYNCGHLRIQNGAVHIDLKQIFKRCLTRKQSQKVILFVIIIPVFLKMDNILTIRIIEEQLTIHMLVPVG